MYERHTYRFYLYNAIAIKYILIIRLFITLLFTKRIMKKKILVKKNHSLTVCIRRTKKRSYGIKLGMYNNKNKAVIKKQVNLKRLKCS